MPGTSTSVPTPAGWATTSWPSATPPTGSGTEPGAQGDPSAFSDQQEPLPDRGEDEQQEASGEAHRSVRDVDDLVTALHLGRHPAVPVLGRRSGRAPAGIEVHLVDD